MAYQQRFDRLFYSSELRTKVLKDLLNSPINLLSNISNNKTSSLQEEMIYWADIALTLFNEQAFNSALEILVNNKIVKLSPDIKYNLKLHGVLTANSLWSYYWAVAQDIQCNIIIPYLKGKIK